MAGQCPGNPDAIGTSRTIVVDPTEYTLLGGLQYEHSLPLADKEVVLTFDDGPLPPYTNRVIEVLASECVKATFFLVGRMARAYPKVARSVSDGGHTIANHSENHPLTFHSMPMDRAAREIEDADASIRAALGDDRSVSPFFRIPGLLRRDAVEHYLTSKGYMTWSVDFLADDWRGISAQEVVRRAINRIEAKGRGILLLHDIKPATVLALPELLKELKARGYRIVHVVAAGPDRPKTATRPEQWALPDAERAPRGVWPRVVSASARAYDPALVAPNPENFGVSDALGPKPSIAKFFHHEPLQTDHLRGSGRKVPLPPMQLWPHDIDMPKQVMEAMLPVPAKDAFSYREIPQTGAAAFVAHKASARRKLVASKPAAAESTASEATPSETVQVETRRPTANVDPAAVAPYPLERERRRQVASAKAKSRAKATSQSSDSTTNYWNYWGSWGWRPAQATEAR
jgi:peptidoglycan/xylan/chitin deacetylase (PgdA/CDA1 family)